MNECSLDLLTEMSEKYKAEGDKELIRLHIHPNTIQKLRRELDKRYIKAFDEFVKPNRFIKEDEIFKIKGESPIYTLLMKTKPEFLKLPPRSNEFDLYERLLRDNMVQVAGVPRHLLIRDVALGSSRPYKNHRNTMSLKAFSKFIKRKQ